MDHPETCPDCNWPVPAVPSSMSEALARSALLDHQFYDCPAGPQAQTAAMLRSVQVAMPS
jgi:hypothetical protein